MPPGRRHPPPLPHLSALVPNPKGAEGRQTPESIAVMYNGILNALRKQEEFNRAMLDGFSGLPAKHGHTHSVGQADALDTPDTPRTVLVGGIATPGLGPSYMREDAQLVVAAGNPVDVDTANAPGVSQQGARADHVHKTLVRVLRNGTLVGMRLSLNIIESTNMVISAADNPGADRVDVTFESSGGGGGDDNTLFSSYLFSGF